MAARIDFDIVGNGKNKRTNTDFGERKEKRLMLENVEKNHRMNEIEAKLYKYIYINRKTHTDIINTSINKMHFDNQPTVANHNHKTSDRSLARLSSSRSLYLQTQQQQQNNAYMLLSYILKLVNAVGKFVREMFAVLHKIKRVYTVNALSISTQHRKTIHFSATLNDRSTDNRV